jgi:NlpC/P60 family putative phage cell wall peptidase
MSGGVKDGAGGPDGAGRRGRVLEVARSFIGTPYRHQGSCKGIGCDCLGLVRGVWREIYGSEPEAPGPYTPDWAERADGEPLIEAALRHLVPVDVAAALPGDLVLFRWRTGARAKHCGFIDAAATGDGPSGGGETDLRLIHAYEGAAVVSSSLTPMWARKMAAAFRFPE